MFSILTSKIRNVHLRIVPAMHSFCGGFMICPMPRSYSCRLAGRDGWMRNVGKLHAMLMTIIRPVQNGKTSRILAKKSTLMTRLSVDFVIIPNDIIILHSVYCTVHSAYCINVQCARQLLHYYYGLWKNLDKKCFMFSVFCCHLQLVIWLWNNSLRVIHLIFHSVLCLKSSVPYSRSRMVGFIWWKCVYKT